MRFKTDVDAANYLMSTYGFVCMEHSGPGLKVGEIVTDGVGSEGIFPHPVVVAEECTVDIFLRQINDLFDDWERPSPPRPGAKYYKMVAE